MTLVCPIGVDVKEVARSLEGATAERIEQELQDLGLLEYCRPALERHEDG